MAAIKINIGTESGPGCNKKLLIELSTRWTWPSSLIDHKRLQHSDQVYAHAALLAKPFKLGRKSYLRLDSLMEIDIWRGEWGLPSIDVQCLQVMVDFSLTRFRRARLTFSQPSLHALIDLLLFPFGLLSQAKVNNFFSLDVIL